MRREIASELGFRWLASINVILKGDSKASIRVWEKLMKSGELHDLS
jgi:hypothetical protein